MDDTRWDTIPMVPPMRGIEWLGLAFKVLVEFAMAVGFGLAGWPAVPVTWCFIAGMTMLSVLLYARMSSGWGA